MGQKMGEMGDSRWASCIDGRDGAVDGPAVDGRDGVVYGPAYKK